MKKLFLFFLIFSILLIFFGCSSNEISENNTPASSEDIEAESLDSLQNPNEDIKAEGSDFTQAVTDNEVSMSDSLLAQLMPQVLLTNKEARDANIYTRPELVKNFTPLDKIVLSGENADILPPITKTTPVSEMAEELENIYSFYNNLMGLKWFSATNMDPYELELYSVKTVLSDDVATVSPHPASSRGLPLNFFRPMENAAGWYYSVSKIGGGYCYTIIGPRPVYEKVDAPTDETDLYIYGSLYSENAVCHSDFSGIQKGSGIKDVIAVDSSVMSAYLLNRFTHESTYRGEDVYRQITSHILLTDGILEITYSPRDPKTHKENNKTHYSFSEDLIVSDIRYFPDFDYIPDKTEGVADWLPEYYHNTAYNQDGAIPIHILPQDYPPAN